MFWLIDKKSKIHLTENTPRLSIEPIAVINLQITFNIWTMIIWGLVWTELRKCHNFMGMHMNNRRWMETISNKLPIGFINQLARSGAACNFWCRFGCICRANNRSQVLWGGLVVLICKILFCIPPCLIQTKMSVSFPFARFTHKCINELLPTHLTPFCIIFSWAKKCMRLVLLVPVSHHTQMYKWQSQWN